ncbi:hypothetical protein B5M43_011960 [Microbacterium sp. MEC084]|uniref:phage baseplate assembly protein V n=1 Tax=Microbacterium sp. MEC084 TaxID=1963027 RepID=UPI00106FECEF|nr:phage baseplate assembly protein V [Microbacterium sp. MEC084]MCD1269539.1 hypothetical protein [Microbacterium sp. MEC084]
MTDTIDLVAPAPAVIPGVRVRVDGAELDVDRVARLTSVRVRREASAPAACALVFEDPVDPAALESALTPGAGLDVAVEGHAVPLFTGDVVVLERAFRADGSVAMTARCQDAAHRLRRDSQLRAHVDVSLAELVRELAEPAGLSVAAGEEGPRLPRLLRDGRSALDLLTRLTREAGLWWQVDAAGGTLRLFDGSGIGHEARAAYGDGLIEAVVTDSALAHRSGWRVVGWDPVTGEVSDGSADSGVDDPDARDAVRGGAVASGADELEALARGLAAEDGASARVVRAVVEGHPELGPGSVLRLAGLTPGATGDFVLLAADHVIDASGGYTCTVTSEPPAHLRALGPAGGRPPRGAMTLTAAQVLRVDDPEARGRVRVTLPAFDGLESEWLPVLALGAGEGKGLALQPDVGDSVLVAHEAGDPGRGVVLGGLRTSDGGEPGVGVVGGAVGVYGMRLPSGQSLRLSADGDALALANAAGSRVALTDTGVVVHAAGDLVLEAPGRLLRLRAGRIELERA